MKPDGYHVRVSAGPLPIAAVERLSATATRQGLAHQASAAAALVTGPRCRVTLLPAATGFLLGTLFDRSGRRCDQIGEEAVAGWIATNGRTLIERYWGAYLAILRTPAGIVAIRDPSGLFPCYYRRLGDAVALGSDLDWVEFADDRAREICWSEIHAQLQYSSLRTVRTAIEGVEELLPGAALHVGGSGLTTEQLWTPYGFASTWGRPQSFDEAADRLRRTTEHSIASWAKLFEKPLIDISGGLDSSIVAAASAPQAPALQAVTYRGGEADLDEGRYAAAVADHLGIPLHREVLDLSLIDLRFSAAAALPRPSGRAFSQANDRQDIALAEALGCDTFFVGAGGDSIFWYFNTAAPALDRLAVEGPGGFLRTVGDLAVMCRVPWTRSLAIALKKRAQRRPRPWPSSTALLAGAAKPLAASPVHPWWPAPPGTLPGVRAYVLALIQLADHHEYHLRSHYAPLIAPLASQPIIETCLGIPSWLSCTKGANRAVARAAFADALPETILARTSKGGFDGFVHDLLERNRTVAQEMLLDGTLAERGWLDTQAIAALLADPAPIAPALSSRMLRLIAVEAWLQSVRSP
ncbi:asparagine synthase-related protein [Sphingomonas sp. KR3-1]|uniref:asparagine synthase-related protein n=1 Tax=Sphingomonas sp. KR3-1 TaxID=3156611 RepID=UPI0032B3BD3E